MMTEADSDLLEMYLDDALPDRELAAVARRIAEEPELAAELQQRRAQRELRRQVFASLEPSDASVERLLGRVDESIRRRSQFERQLRWGRWAAAAAACVVVGFSTGYLGRGPVDPSAPGLAVNSNVNVVDRPNHTLIANGADEGQRDGIQFFGKIRPKSEAAVQLTDDSGRVVAVQHFESTEQAREFANDLRAWQERQHRMRSGNVQLMGGKF